MHYNGSVVDNVDDCTHSVVITIAVGVNVEDGIEVDVDNDKDNKDFNFNVGSSTYNAGIGNLDLGHIVNGFVGDPIETRPFEYFFQKHKLLNQWTKMGFLPMTCNAVNDLKID